MILPIQTTFRNVEQTPEIEEAIQARVRKLERFYSPITSCRVLVEAPARYHRKGSPFHIRIELTVPQGEIVVNAPSVYAVKQDVDAEGHRKEMEKHAERKYLKVALREAFDAARRRLQDHARRIRADVKTHEPLPQARISKLFPADGYGYLETPDGREVYFHANSVINNAFENLKLGARVTFTEETGEKGPQASTVKIIRKTKPTVTLPPVLPPSSGSKPA